MRSSSSTRCASTRALNTLPCRTSSDNPAKSSALPKSTNRYWSLMTLVYHAQFRPAHRGLHDGFVYEMASRSIAPPKGSPREGWRKQSTKPNSLLTTRQPGTRNSSTKQNKNDHQPSNHKRAGEQVMRAWPCSSSLHRPRLRESCEPARRARDTRRGASWRGTSAAQTFPQRATRFATPDGVSPEGQRAATPT